ncbi:MAG: PilZ domain-containing protein [Planctomycetota bacterium]|jgi:c-di-GMP-binding flagellar brake protein YcgR
MAHERTEPDQEVGERRRHLRYAVASRVRFVEVGKPTTTYEGRLRDLSSGGICLVTSQEVSVGARLWLGIFFDHLRDGPLIILAEVRRCGPEENGFALGLEFLRTTNAQAKALGHVVHCLVERDDG